MKKLGAFLTMISLLSLVPAAFAVDGGVPAYRSGARSLVGREASDVPPSQAGNTPCSADQTWHPGDLRWRLLDAKRVYEKTTRGRARDTRQELHNAERAAAPQR